MKYLFPICTLLLLSCGKSEQQEKAGTDSTTVTINTTTSDSSQAADSLHAGKDVLEYRIDLKKVAPVTFYVFMNSRTIGLVNADKKMVQTFPVSEQVDFENEFYHDPSTFISAEDFNFDGYKDLMLLTSSGTGGQWYDIYLYDNGKKEFVLNKELSELTSPSTDSVNQTVKMYGIGGMAGAWYSSAVYKWKGDKLAPIREEEQTSEDPETEVFIRTISLANTEDKMKVASSVRIAREGENKEKHCLLEGDWTEFDKNPNFLFVESADDVIRVDGRNGNCD